MERVQASHNNHWGLKRKGSFTYIIDIKGSGNTLAVGIHNTQKNKD